MLEHYCECDTYVTALRDYDVKIRKLFFLGVKFLV